MESHTESSGARRDGGEQNSRDSSRGRGGKNRAGYKGKKRDLGRSAWSKQKGDKRKQVENTQTAKRRKLGTSEEKDLPVYATKFSEEVLKAEERRPKKKVAVMIGYSGTGYKGMQLAPDQKTIEGDLFKAFVEAGAISKANADDPKKSSFVRCARTDKGVHAAGNVISLKLIVEDEDIVQKINEHLDPQIRVWGYERTNNSFSAYQLVDSRIYEYFIPTHSLLPPHPSSYLGKKCVEWANKKGETEIWTERQKDVKGYWEKVDEDVIKPILNEYDEDTRSILEKALWLKSDADTDNNDEDATHTANLSNEDKNIPDDISADNQNTANEPRDNSEEAINQRRQRARMINEAVRKLRQAYITAKRSYRVSESRLTRLGDTLNQYVGTRNYHNYTIQKDHNDASAKRVIKSFIAADKPIEINGTEWLSLKVHGQSFMMHQIRKMVGMATLIVRCGADPHVLIPESYGHRSISIPKAPSLGLLLERPIFESYNKRATKDMGHQAIDFDNYKEEMEKFKQTQIYERMWANEEKDNVFGNFFNHIDNFPASTFLFVTSGGIDATLEGREEGGEHLQSGKGNEGTRSTQEAKNQHDIGKMAQSREAGVEGIDSDDDNVKDDAGNEG